MHEWQLTYDKSSDELVAIFINLVCVGEFNCGWAISGHGYRHEVHVLHSDSGESEKWTATHGAIF